MSAARIYVGALALVVAASTAHADDERIGTLGAANWLRFHAGYGPFSAEVVRDERGQMDYESTGRAWFTRTEASFPLGLTRFKSVTGLEVGLDLAWVGKGETSREGIRVDPPAGGLLAVLDGGMVTSIVLTRPFRLWLRAGGSISFDAATVYGGTRLWFGGKKRWVEISADLRYGQSHSDAQVRQSQVRLSFYSNRYVAIDVHVLNGFSERAQNLTSSTRLFKGAYSLATLGVSVGL